MQATADDEMAALSLGVSADFVYAVAWAIAFMAAGVGGSLLGNINGLNISIGYLGLLVLPAVVLGGLNSVPGAIVGGISIGILQNLAGGYLDHLTPGGVKDIFPFVVMAIVLLFRPYGLWGWARRPTGMRWASSAITSSNERPSASARALSFSTSVSRGCSMTSGAPCSV